MIKPLRCGRIDILARIIEEGSLSICDKQTKDAITADAEELALAPTDSPVDQISSVNADIL